MQFLQKINKLVSIILMAAGGTVSVGSIVMLGYGTQAKYYVDITNSKQKWFYIGSLNFNKNFNADITYSIAVSRVRGILENWNRLYWSSTPETEWYEKTFKNFIRANDIMIAGAVLFSMSSLMLIVGVVFFVLNKMNIINK